MKNKKLFSFDKNGQMYIKSFGKRNFSAFLSDELILAGLSFSITGFIYLVVNYNAISENAMMSIPSLVCVFLCVICYFFATDDKMELAKMMLQGLKFISLIVFSFLFFNFAFVCMKTYYALVSKGISLSMLNLLGCFFIFVSVWLCARLIRFAINFFKNSSLKYINWRKAIGSVLTVISGAVTVLSFLLQFVFNFNS